VTKTIAIIYCILSRFSHRTHSVVLPAFGKLRIWPNDNYRTRSEIYPKTIIKVIAQDRVHIYGDAVQKNIIALIQLQQL